MAIVIGFCASRSNTGKTTLVLKILKELQKKGLCVAVLKHSGHFSPDEGKDSSRYAREGAAASLLVSPRGWVLESRPENELAPEKAAELLCDVTGCEVLLVEGYKKSRIPRIAVCRSDVSLELPCDAGELLAVVSDVPVDCALPQFRFEDLAGICDFILSLP